jgi:hypothetical protein
VQTAEETRQRAQIQVSISRLPPGIKAVEGSGAAPGTCCACGGEEESTDDQLLQCDACRQFVHMGCYDVEHPPEGRLWLCDLCELGAFRRLCFWIQTCHHDLILSSPISPRLPAMYNGIGLLMSRDFYSFPPVDTDVSVLPGILFLGATCSGVESHMQFFWDAGVSTPPACALCPIRGGMMKRTNCGAWCHLACANWTPETALDPESGLICGVRCVSKVCSTGRVLALCSIVITIFITFYSVWGPHRP